MPPPVRLPLWSLLVFFLLHVHLALVFDELCCLDGYNLASAWILVKGEGGVASRVAELPPQVHFPKGQLRVFTFGDVPSFCPVDPALLGALLLPEF